MNEKKNNYIYTVIEKEFINYYKLFIQVQILIFYY